MRGRKPLPTNVKVLRGNPGKRKLNKSEPKPSGKLPACPHWLTLEAKREWRRVLPELKAMGLLTVVDRAALAAYCEAWACFRQAQEVVQEKGITHEEPIMARVKGENGVVFEKIVGYKVKQRPEVAVSLRYFQILSRMVVEFGFTPSSRGRMTIPGQEEKDPFEEFLSGGQS